MVGYRYWTTTGKHPLFPFGYGLSYTTFKFSNLKRPPPRPPAPRFQSASTSPTPATWPEPRSRSSTSPTHPRKSDRPERELKGFAKVRLAPGETRHVTLMLDARAFSYWDQSAHKWIIDPGKFVLRVGDSSENTPLHADIDLH